MDVIGDMLTIIRNAQAVKKETAYIPYSKLKMSIAEVLAKEGFIKDVSRKGKKYKRIISVELKYGEDGSPAINSIKRISKPSKRVYLPLGRIYSVQGGRGLRVLTTPKGVLSDKEARKEKVGGEVVCEIW